MKETNKKRMLSYVLAVIILFVMIFSVYFVTTHEKHHCSGVDCSVCYALQIFQETSKVLGTAIIAIISAIYLCKILFSDIYTNNIREILISLINLKIRLNI